MLDFIRLQSMDDKAARRNLTAISGVGPWTAEIYLLTAMGRADAWPGGDIALRSAAASLFDRVERPSLAEMTVIAAPWAPFRSVAALLLWSHYRRLKGLPPADVTPSQERHTIYSTVGTSESKR
jgi:DNA-3-methyladenine glycosylase II